LIPAGDQSSHFVHVPDVVLVFATLRRLTRFRIALVSQLAVAVDGVVAAPLKLIAYGGLTGTGKALDQIVPSAHALNGTRRPPAS